MKSILFLVLTLLLVAVDAKAQNNESYYVYKNNDTIQQVDGLDYLRKLFKIKPSQDSIQNKKVNFSLFPTDNHNADGRVLVTSFNATFSLGEAKNTNNSTVYFIPYISFNNQFGVELYPTIWLNKNSWNFVGEYYIMNFPQDTWGLGGNTPSSNETLVDGKQIGIYQNVLKGIFPNFAIGLGYALNEHYDLENENDTIPTDEDFPEEQSGKSVSSAIVFPAVYDSRKNIINPQGGFYTSFNYRNNNTAFGSDTNWQSIFLDVRKYFPIPNTRSIWAFRTYYWSIVSGQGQVPYFDLPSTGSDPGTGISSRGIQKNRYRSNAMAYFETEYRFNITRNGFLGGVVFTNVTSASQYNTQDFEYWKPAAGFGVRLKFNKFTKMNIALDFGFSKEYASIYLNLGEVF